MPKSKPAALRSTIAIPTSLHHTKKLVEEKAKVEVVEERKEIVVETVSAEKPKTVLTQVMLDSRLFEIRDFYKQANKNLELAILDQKINVVDSVISLQVMGHVQEEIANKIRPELTGLIRKLTGADDFSIQVELREEMESQGPKLYTNSDKFNHLKSKHPALAELQRKFGLDVDF
ncbi:MAG: hypothetical protein LPK25_03525 [Cyclobacteriaceae bacterium]|nr:hypothetical protein [Cyclobacteriaceae bacterium]